MEASELLVIVDLEDYRIKVPQKYVKRSAPQRRENFVFGSDFEIWPVIQIQ